MKLLECWAARNWHPHGTGLRRNQTQPHHLRQSPTTTRSSPTSPRAPSQRAKMKSMPQQGEIELLIATDCISEGQNLQDCDLPHQLRHPLEPGAHHPALRPYRPNRQCEHSIQLVNFWPTEDLNKYINLKNRVEARMALVDISATFEDNVLRNEDSRNSFRRPALPRQTAPAAEGRSARPGRLQRIRGAERIQPRRLPHGPGRLHRSQPEKLEEAPFGLYAVVPASPSTTIKPGVIYCLKQQHTSQRQRSGQPTAALLSGLHPRRRRSALQLHRAQASPGNLPRRMPGQDRALCRPVQAVRPTNRPRQDMSAYYSGLLDKAVAAIVAQFGRKNAANLFTGRGGKLMDAIKRGERQQRL
jgi:hypothetical protein